MAAAGFLVFRQGDGHVFLVRRSIASDDPGVWSIPGGALQPGEDDAQAAVRETTEEVGSFPELLMADEPDVREGRLPYTTFVMEMAQEDGETWEPDLNWEHDAWGWFALDDLPEPLHENVRRVLRRYR